MVVGDVKFPGRSLHDQVASESTIAWNELLSRDDAQLDQLKEKS